MPSASFAVTQENPTAARTWVRPGAPGSYLQVPATLVAGSGEVWFGNLFAYQDHVDAGALRRRIVLEFSNAQGTGATHASGNELIPGWESALDALEVIRSNAGAFNRTFTARGPNATGVIVSDMNEPYSWEGPDGENGDDLYDMLRETAAGNLTVRLNAPDAPPAIDVEADLDDLDIGAIEATVSVQDPIQLEASLDALAVGGIEAEVQPPPEMIEVEAALDPLALGAVEAIVDFATPDINLRLGERYWVRLDDESQTPPRETRNTLSRVPEGATFVPSQLAMYGQAARVGVEAIELRRVDPVTQAVATERTITIATVEADPIAWQDDVRFALAIPADGEAPAWAWWTGDVVMTIDGLQFLPHVLIDARPDRNGRGFEILVGPPQDTVEEAWFQTYRDLRPCELWPVRRTADGWRRARRIGGVLSAVRDNRDGTYTCRVQRADDPAARNANFGGEFFSDESQKRLHDPTDECAGYAERIGTEGVEGIWPQPPAEGH